MAVTTGTPLALVSRSVHPGTCSLPKVSTFQSHVAPSTWGSLPVPRPLSPVPVPLSPGAVTIRAICAGPGGGCVNVPCLGPPDPWPWLCGHVLGGA